MAVHKVTLAPPATSSRQELARDLKVSHAAAIVVGTIIGSGIFLVPAEMMQAVGSSKLVYLAWVVGGFLSFFGALTYAELSAMKPQAGGEYIYMRDGYGPLGGFLYAWTWFLISKPGSIATITTGLVRILGTFAVFSFLPRPIASIHLGGSANPIEITYGTLVAIAAVVLISTLNYIGVKKAGDFHLIFTLLKVAMILVIVVAAFTYARGSWANFSGSFSGAKGGINGFVAALVAALWAYDGWNQVVTVSGEIKNPQRSLPVALISGVAVVAALYMAVNAAVQYVMPASAIAASPRPASDATAIALGAVGAAVVSAGMALSMLVTLNGSIMTGARIPYAVAHDGYFFHPLAAVHPKFRTPSIAIIVQALMAIGLLLVAGSFKELFSLTIFSEFLVYVMATSTVFIFRVREPKAPRPYKTWGYPVVPLLFIIVSGLLLYYTFVDNVRNSLIGVAIILAGIPVFLYFAKRRAAA
jgi:APA family basic amino acid/polyamine antiporter